MGKFVPKFHRNGRYDDESEYVENMSGRNKQKKKNQRKLKYYDEYESYDSRRQVRPSKAKPY